MIKDDQIFPVARPSTQTDQPAESLVYEQMHRYLYDYRFGRITFLELLEKWKEVLNLTIGGNQ